MLPLVRETPQSYTAKRFCLSGLGVSFQPVRFDFPQNRGASPGQLEADAVELTQLKVLFNPFTSGI